MQKITEQDVIDYALKEHHVPSAYAKNWFQYWTKRNWITTTGRAILNWRVKFDWWVLDNKSRLILTESSPEPPTAAEIRARQLQRQHEERERQERIYQQELADPNAQAEIAAIQARLLHQFQLFLVISNQVAHIHWQG